MSSTAFDICTTRLADLVEAAAKTGPQVVTKDGSETAVIVSINDWKLISGWRDMEAEAPGRCL